ncbi:MAG: AAC(3) family N-acetyltransferase [Alphaproteobacteria bacterium]|nr:AAC(3) family N-acetyltransferase [Alphaproteobacteria bacterium]MCB9792243.1 AAC(3) family N-acetyltransferase [Alphaproteobacteria bacterium]
MSLLAQLRALGVAPGDALMLHASMRRVGGRAEALLDALEAAVGPEGALLMLICASEEAPFDPETSPAWDELGVLAEVFRRRAGVVRNAHPVARFAAWGRGARALVEDPPLHDYYGPGSPLERLVARGGKVLRLGADPDTVTLLHLGEYLCALPHKRRTTHAVVIAGQDAPLEVGCLDDEHGLVDWEGEDYFSLILKDFLARGCAASGPVGGALCELIPAASILSFSVNWMERTLV